MIEIERTFLAKRIPEGLSDCDFIEIKDTYFPKSSFHPKIRLRKKGGYYELTKKKPVNDDPSHQEEQTIKLTREEYESFKSIDGRVIHKNRYFLPFNNRVAEVDVFLDKLKGLVLIDFEFNNPVERDSFSMPDFCLADVTNEDFIAGGMLCGKSYEDIATELKRFNYKKLLF